MTGIRSHLMQPLIACWASGLPVLASAASTDPSVSIRMEIVNNFPVLEVAIVNQWRCWIGLNVSHSMAGMLFGLVYGYLAVAHASLLFGSPYLLAVGLLLVGGLFAVAKAYWFSSPLIGTGIALACCVASIIVAPAS